MSTIGYDDPNQYMQRNEPAHHSMNNGPMTHRGSQQHQSMNLDGIKSKQD